MMAQYYFRSEAVSRKIVCTIKRIVVKLQSLKIIEKNRFFQVDLTVL